MPTRTGGLGRADQGLRVVVHVDLHERRDEVVVVVVAFVPAHCQRLSRFPAGRFEDLRVELLLEEFVCGSLVHEYGPAVGEGTPAPESVNSSVCQTPDARISTSTSPSVGPSNSTVSIFNGSPAPNATAAFTSTVPPPL